MVFPMLFGACADAHPVEMHAGTSATFRSPDCKWAIVMTGRDGRMPKVKVHGRLLPDTASIVQDKTGLIIATIHIPATATAYWLKDGNSLVISNREGSAQIRPQIVHLSSDGPPVVDLTQLLITQTVGSLKIERRDVFHFFAAYSDETASAITVAAKVDYMPAGTDKPETRCLIYSVAKPAYRTATLTRTAAPEVCAHNAGEQ